MISSPVPAHMSSWRIADLVYMQAACQKHHQIWVKYRWWTIINMSLTLCCTLTSSENERNYSYFIFLLSRKQNVKGVKLQKDFRTAFELWKKIIYSLKVSNSLKKGNPSSFRRQHSYFGTRHWLYTLVFKYIAERITFLMRHKTRSFSHTEKC